MWHELLKLWLLALLFAALLMGVVWMIAVRIRNAGIVDIAWSAGFAPLALFFAWTGDGQPPRRALIAALVTLWSLRLGLHLYLRVMSHHPTEDRRYAELRRDWGASVNRNMFWFFQLQALLLAVLSLPALMICLNRNASIGALEIVGALLFVVALAGESIADRQLAHHRADASLRNGVCEIGLWHYSRHPNYFFEWLIWVALFTIACAARGGWLTIYCPVLMLYFLLKVTGIPMTERLSLESRGAAFADYQRRVSVFVPWFPKRS